MGAGISGIKCAYDLFKTKNYEILILESSSTIGGRIKHFDFHGKTFELGANWISNIKDEEDEDKNENPIWKLAKNVKNFGGNYELDDYVVRGE